MRALRRDNALESDQPRDDALELRGVEDDLELRHRVWAQLLAAEPAALDGKCRGERLAELLGNREGFAIVVDMA
jgi:hypothetical protein